MVQPAVRAIAVRTRGKVAAGERRKPEHASRLTCNLLFWKPGSGPRFRTCSYAIRAGLADRAGAAGRVFYACGVGDRDPLACLGLPAAENAAVRHVVAVGLAAVAVREEPPGPGEPADFGLIQLGQRPLIGGGAAIIAARRRPFAEDEGNVLARHLFDDVAIMVLPLLLRSDPIAVGRDDYLPPGIVRVELAPAAEEDPIFLAPAGPVDNERNVDPGLPNPADGGAVAGDIGLPADIGARG